MVKVAVWVAVVSVAAAMTVSPAGAQTVDLQAGGAQNFVSPTRVLDTRIGVGLPGPIPAHTAAVVTIAPPDSLIGDGDLHVTVVDPGASGYLSVFGAGVSTPPPITDVNFTRGVTTSNTVVAAVPQNPVDVLNALDFFNASDAAVNVVADYVGFTDPGSQYVAGTFRAINPTRMLDTRSGIGTRPGRVPAGGTISFLADATPRFEDQPVPEVSAVVLNLSAIDPAAGGYVTAFESGTVRPATSSVNFAAGRTTDNFVVVPLDPSGRVSIYNGSRGALDLTADVAGYYRSIVGVPAEAGTYQSVPSVRAVDTRRGIGSEPIPAHGTVRIVLGGHDGISAARAGAVAVNLTAVDAIGAGYLTAWPAGSQRPATDNLNFPAGGPAANLALVPMGSAGAIDVYNGSAHAVQVLVDVSGYYLNAAPPGPTNTSTWSTLTLLQPKSPELVWNTVSCVSSGFCASIAGDTVDTFDNQHTQKQYLLDSSSTLSNQGGLISCATPTFCAAFTASGESFAFNGASWSGPLSTGLTGLTLLLSCTAPGFCMAIGQHGAATLTGTTWTAVPPPPWVSSADPATPYLSCATPSFCMTVGSDGLASVFNGSTWSEPVSMDAGAPFGVGPTALSCPTATFCMVMDKGGNAIAYTSGTWQAPVNLADNGDYAATVSCTSSTFCASSMGNNYLGGTTWTTSSPFAANIPNGNPISCGSPTFCVIDDGVQAEIGQISNS